VAIKTSRLILRQWQDSDLAPFAALNADPRVREFFPSLQSREESDRDVKCASDHLARYGWGFWAVSLIETGEFIGFIGLEDIYFQAHFTPAVEIGWRLAFDYWGKGYATEGAKAALKYGFETLRLDQIVSFTPVSNMRSRRVMEKIGMHHNKEDDFDHPKLIEGHPLRKHVLYRILSHDWFGQSEQKYVYKPYNSAFPSLFQKEKVRISPFLKNAMAIEHIGSTAIPNLGGKGIIDIALSVPKEEMKETINILEKLGYQYRSAFSTPERFYFVAYLPDAEEGRRRYHIHLTYPSSQVWNELIGFRDYLRTHPEAVEEYASIKKNAALTANCDGNQYRKMKEPMFQKIKAFIEGK
ncbi:MAG: GNAT family N-acetyltransferase, partial [Parachlamydiaceae bacterium]